MSAGIIRLEFSPDSNGWNFRMWLNDKQIAYHSGGSTVGPLTGAVLGLIRPKTSG